MTTSNPATGSGTMQQLLSSLLKQLDCYAAQVSEKRADARHPVHAPVLLGIRLAHDGSFKSLYRAWAMEISAHGISVLTDQDLPTGMQIYMNIESLVGKPCVIPMRLVYCSQLLPNTYRVGGMFLVEEEGPELRLVL